MIVFLRRVKMKKAMKKSDFPPTEEDYRRAIQYYGSSARPPDELRSRTTFWLKDDKLQKEETEVSDATG